MLIGSTVQWEGCGELGHAGVIPCAPAANHFYGHRAQSMRPWRSPGLPTLASFSPWQHASYVFTPLSVATGVPGQTCPGLGAVQVGWTAH